MINRENVVPSPYDCCVSDESAGVSDEPLGESDAPADESDTQQSYGEGTAFFIYQPMSQIRNVSNI